MKRILGLALSAALLSGPAFAVAVTSTSEPTTVENGAITTGGTFQQISAGTFLRKSFEFYNNNAAHPCYLYFGTTAAATQAKSVVVIAGAYYGRFANSVPSDAIQVTCSTTSDTFWAQEQ